MPVAVNYMFLRDNRPEVLVEFGDLIELNDDKPDRKNTRNFLQRHWKLFVINSSMI